MAPKSLPERSWESPGAEKSLGTSKGALGEISSDHRKNLAIVEREARSTREPQALQATEHTRIEARTDRRTRAKGHEEQQSKRGESNARIKIASVVDHLSPCSRAARARRAFGAGAFREFRAFWFGAVWLDPGEG